MATTTITVHDEGARHVLASAVARHAADVMGENFYDVLGGYAYDVLRGYAIPLAVENPEFEQTLFLLAASNAALDRLGSLKLGDAIKLPMSSSELRATLDACRASMEEDEGFWSLPSDRRALFLAQHDALATILTQLPVEAVA